MITCIILTRNEEKNIKNCLDSVSFCDEVIVIDDNSTDNTKKISEKYGAVFITHSLQDDFAAQRNYALKRAKNEWVLFIDADEVVTDKLAKSIQLALLSDSVQGYYINRQDEMFGEILKHGELKDKKFLRLGLKTKGKWEGKVHETWSGIEKTGILKGDLLHYPHKTLSEFIAEINFYTTLRAQELKDQGQRSNIFTIIFYTKAKFFQIYVLKLGFLDGMSGLLLSTFMSFHSFLVRSKLYLLQVKK